MAEIHLFLEEPLEYRVAAFKDDPEKMKQISDFLDDIFEKARIEAESKMIQKEKGKPGSLGLQNGTRRIGAWSNRARSSARTLASRVFTAICNCTNTVKSAVVNRN